MNTNLPLTSKPKANAGFSGNSVNPFAKALQETEKYATDNGRPQSDIFDQNSMLSQALAQQGGDKDLNQNPLPNQADILKQQQEEAQKKAKELQRRKLHEQVNPLDMHNVFDAREKRVKEEINNLRRDLEMMMNDMRGLRSDVEITLMSEVVSPGQDGKYYLNFFQKLREFILLLRQRINSARTWAKQMHGKNAKKKKGKFAPGMVLDGAVHEKGKAIHDMMHHEQSNAYAGS